MNRSAGLTAALLAVLVAAGCSSSLPAPVSSAARPRALALSPLVVATPAPPPLFRFVIPTADISNAENVTVRLDCGGATPGDANGDGKVDILDVFQLINGLYASGPKPVPPPCSAPNHAELGFPAAKAPLLLYVCDAKNACMHLTLDPTATK